MTHLSVVGRQICLECETPDLCSTSSGRGYFEPTPCSWAEGLAPLESWGATVEPPTSTGTLGAAIEPPTSIGS